MREDQQRFLSLAGQLPARLTVEQAAWVLNCQTHDVPVLIASRLLKPLGNPPPNGIKFFATAEVLDSVKDRSWLAKISNTVNQHWQKKNARCRNRAPKGAASEPAACSISPRRSAVDPSPVDLKSRVHLNAAFAFRMG